MLLKLTIDLGQNRNKIHDCSRYHLNFGLRFKIWFNSDYFTKNVGKEV